MREKARANYFNKIRRALVAEAEDKQVRIPELAIIMSHVRASSGTELVQFLV
jgi:hypothetical protein